MKPQIRDFVYLRALRMGEANLLEGARHAASAVQSAVEASLTDGDNNALDSMLHAGNLAAPIHAALLDECARGRKTEGAVELMLEELSRQRQTIKEGTASVASLLLIAGVQRREAAGGLAGLHRMRIGSHLLVVDTSPDGLYGVERQRELMLRSGACVLLSPHAIFLIRSMTRFELSRLHEACYKWMLQNMFAEHILVAKSVAISTRLHGGFE